jgi:transcriptional antiterminator NusG
MNWYVVHTYAAYEFKVKEAIEKGVQGTDLEEKLGQILIPTQKTFLIRDGKKIEREKKIFTSYIIIQADLTPELQKFIQSIPGVTNFLGITGKSKKPHPLPENEVNRLLGIADRDKDDAKGYDFIPGDMVKITSGPFNDFDGVIEKISDNRKKLTVKVTVFGRVTPVEVRFDQVEII